MNDLRKKLKNNPLIKRLSSIRITVTCLFLLFVLVFWGTVAQIDNGLYQAQERYFHSLFFLVFGFIPFPGAQLVLWVLFFNLICVALTRFVYDRAHLGIMIIHCGLLTYFVSAFVTLHVVEESNVTLMAGDGTNVSSSYHDWELSLWKERTVAKQNITAYDLKDLSLQSRIDLPEFGFSIVPKIYYPNAQAYTGAGNGEEVVNGSGIGTLKRSANNKEPEKNLPGLIFEFNNGHDRPADVLLFGGESASTKLSVGDQKVNVQLRRKRRPLPFLITLKKFTKEVHPGTEIARSYQSLVEIEHDGIAREVLIYMNNPLRYKNYTLYQASYSVDALGRESSTLAVVKNSGRLLPYLSALIVFSGLATHFLMMAFRSNKRERNA